MEENVLKTFMWFLCAFMLERKSIFSKKEKKTKKNLNNLKNWNPLFRRLIFVDNLRVKNNKNGSLLMMAGNSFILITFLAKRNKFFKNKKQSKTQNTLSTEMKLFS